MRGDRPRVIVEEYIDFDYEITLLTVATRDGIVFCPPIGHRQESGDYRTSWQPAAMDETVLKSAQEQAAKVVTALGGHGLFGVEFFIAKGRAIFSELSPRPHDTGMVTLIGQSPNEFELHVRAILGLPIPELRCEAAAASAVILADRASSGFSFEGVADAMAEADVRLFSKPTTLPNRRMGVALAIGREVDEALARAQAAADKVRIEYG
jgi:phosphoribosylglycinamide formyltransferase 2